MRQVLGPGALGRPRGIGWRGRWEGGPGWGIHVNPWLIHFSVWQKPLQCCKVISLQLIKINEKKKTHRILEILSPNISFNIKGKNWDTKNFSDLTKETSLLVTTLGLTRCVAPFLMQYLLSTFYKVEKNNHKFKSYFLVQTLPWLDQSISCTCTTCSTLCLVTNFLWD